MAPAIVAGVLAFVGQQSSRAWQKRQQDFQIKTELISQLSEASAELMSAVQTREFERGSERPGSFIAAYRSWDAQSQVIDAKIDTYYKAGPGLERRWQRFVELMRLYALLPDEKGRPVKRDKNVTSSSTRTHTLNALGREASVSIPPVLQNRPLYVRSDVAYNNAWVALKTALIRRRDGIVRQLETAALARP